MKRFAGDDATTALDALGRVTHKARVCVIRRCRATNIGEIRILNVKTRAEALKVAVLVARAGETALVVAGEQEL